jgi:hypothetical protein
MRKSFLAITIICVSILAASFPQQSYASQSAPQPAQTPAAAPEAPASTCPNAPTQPVVTGPFNEGAVLIAGTANKYGDGCISYIEVHATTAAGGDTVLPLTGDSDPAVRRGDGTYSVKLQTGLAKGQSITVKQIFLNTKSAAAPVPDSISSVATAVQALSTQIVPKPQIAGKLREGANAISGTTGALPQNPAAGGGGGTQQTCSAQVEAHDASGGNDELLQLTTGLKVNVNSTDNTFSLTLQEPLREGQTIRIDEIFQGCTTPGLPAKVSSELVSVTVPGDWGRIRGYFTTGILLSQDEGSFSQSSVFLGFTLDKTWRMPGYYHQLSHKAEAEKELRDAEDKVRELTAGGKQDSKAVDKLKKAQEKRDKAKIEAANAAVKNKLEMGRWPGINTFFDTRLTSIPVSACNPTTTTTTTTTTSSTGNNSPCSAPTSTSSTTPSNLDTFLSQRKTARLAVGAYFPWTITTWNYNKTPNALFFAPLVKAGFDTPTGDLTQVQTVTTTGPTTTVNSGTIGVNPSTFYNFHGYGARIGHYALTTSNGAPDRNKAPELVSYLDVIFGPFSNLETLIVPKGAPSTTPASRTRLYRVALEGIMKVPSTPLIVGFSANVGQEALWLGKHDVVQRAGDDLRFLFGAKFDAAKLMAAIAKAAP